MRAMENSPPYPADTRAKGWRFELEPERIAQSDTWSLAAEIPMAQHCLLMMWMVAWEQTPCGSFPSDENLIRAKCKVPPDLWASCRAVLMRGWWLADDGRMYHPTLTARVQEMMNKRRSDADRKATSRNRKPKDADSTHAGVTRDKTDDSTNVPPDTCGTPPGIHPESSTDHRPPTTDNPNTNTPPTPHRAGWDADEGGEDSIGGDEFPPSRPMPTPAGVICRLLRQAGVPKTNPGHPTLTALLAAGATEAEFLGAVPDAKNKGDPFAYVLAVVVKQRERAAALTLHQGELPATETAYQRSARELAEQVVPAIAAKRPGTATARNPMEILDDLIRLPGR